MKTISSNMGRLKKKKSFMRHFRYFSQIFESHKEPEMQIGIPTDVKHVAHIGWDGPNVNNPSWMKDYSSADPLNPTPGGEVRRDSPAAAPMEGSRESESPAAAREFPSGHAEQNSTAAKKKHSRRPSSDGTTPSDSSAEGTRRGRKTKKKYRDASADPSGQEAQVPKQTNRRRSKSSAKSKAATIAAPKATSDAEAEDAADRPSLPAVNQTAEE